MTINTKARSRAPSREELAEVWGTLTFKQMAERFGYSVMGIRQLGLRLGLPDRGRKATIVSRSAALRAQQIVTTKAVEDTDPEGPVVTERIDAEAARLKADAEDLALIGAAARKHSAGLNGLVHLVGLDHEFVGRTIVDRCVAKGWMRLGANPFTLHRERTFEVLAAGYRAAGMKVPPFLF